MFDFIANLLAFFYDNVWQSFGGAIILLTLAIMLVLTPFSIKGTRSMLAMSRLQPELKKLQQEHKGDREALNREMMAFYQEHKINPLSSCLPLLLQMPVFIVLYRVIDGLSRVEERVVDGATIEGPKYLDSGTQLYQDLARRIVDTPDGGQTISMTSFGIDLSRTLSGVVSQDDVITAIPFIILVAIVAVSGYIQQKQVSGRSPAASANPQQQMLLKVMPVMFAVISIGIPAGVVLYFVVSNIIRIGQQGLVTYMEGDNLKPKVDEPKGGKGAGAKTKARDTKAANGKDAKGGKGAGDGKAANGKAGNGKAGNGKAAPQSSARAGGNGRANPPGPRPRKKKKKRK